MNTTQPIRDLTDLENVKKYYTDIRPNERNQLLIVLGLNTALRISDVLSLCWHNVYDFEHGKYREHICIVEQKTQKKACVYINQNILHCLHIYQKKLQSAGKEVHPDDFLFSHSNKNVPITRVQAFRIIKNAAEYYQIPGNISCHSLRKTLGYQAWNQGVSPVLLVSIYNHSSYKITKRYLGIEQEDRDKIFRKIRI